MQFVKLMVSDYVGYAVKKIENAAIVEICPRRSGMLIP